ncbi:hypothetical protein [Providencia rustigianii]|uniref:hypothetical protein n=1 Tax=Providencia rustigianii TaxID=158850 RepID=UPI00223ED944|nr:hypothetical protein [Providencia rustigianii]
MKIDKMDIQLYLQRQSNSRMLKVTVFIENTLMPTVLTPMLVFVVFYAALFAWRFLVGFHDPELLHIIDLAGYYALGCVCVLVLIGLFFRGYLPKIKAQLTVHEIEMQYKAAEETYTRLNYAPEDERPAIDYLNAVVMSGVPMNGAHTRTVDTMLALEQKASADKDALLKVKQELSALTDSIAKTSLTAEHIQNDNHIE